MSDRWNSGYRRKSFRAVINQAAPCAARTAGGGRPHVVRADHVARGGSELRRPLRREKYTTGPTASATGPQIRP